MSALARVRATQAISGRMTGRLPCPETRPSGEITPTLAAPRALAQACGWDAIRDAAESGRIDRPEGPT